MEIIIDRPWADYAKDLGYLCENWCQASQVSSTVFYTGYLDGLNNVWIQRWFQNPQIESVITVIANDYLSNGSAHFVRLNELASINKKFIIVTEVNDAQADFQHYDNIQFAHMGPSLVAENRYYNQVQPQRFKNLTSGPHWISLNRATRPQRMLVASVLANAGFGIDNDPSGILKIDSRNHGTQHPIKNYREWRDILALYVHHVPNTDHLQQLDISPDLDSKLEQGWNILWNNRHTPQDLNDFPDDFGRQLNNHQNFDQNLRKYYQTAVVEFVPETLYFCRGQLVSEKFTNSVMGFCFPIMIAVPGTVAYLRSLGFDMFDDVIDHSYDQITDPVERAFALVERNQHLLLDPVGARSAWLRCVQRFENNYQHIAQGTLLRRCRDQLRFRYGEIIKNLA